MTTATCPLCRRPGAADPNLLWEDDRALVVLVDQSQAEHVFPGYCRVVWHDHVAEMTDLSPAERAHLMDIVWDVEASLRAVLAPTKINLASFGNFVPHLHWHLIPRWQDDSYFPEAYWAAPPEKKEIAPPTLRAERLASASRIRAELARRRSLAAGG